MSPRPHTRHLIFLARHGETDWNREGRWQGHTDIPLNARGRDQAEVLAARLKGTGVVRVLSSDLKRAQETARITSQLLPAEFVCADPRLRERGFGIFEGRTRADLAREHPEVWSEYLQNRRVTPPGAEPHEHIIARLRAGFEDAARAANGHPTLLVSHGGAIRILLAALTGDAQPPVENAAVFRLETTLDGTGQLSLLSYALLPCE